MKNPFKSKRKRHSTERMADVYLEHLSTTHETNASFLDQVLDSKNIYFDDKTLDKVPELLEKSGMVKRVEGDGVPKPFTIFSFNPDAGLSDMSQFENIFYKYVATPKGKYFYNHGQKIAYKEYEEDREKLRKRIYKWFEIVFAFATGAASHIFYNWIDMRYFNN